MNRREWIGGAATLLLGRGAIVPQPSAAPSGALPASREEFPITGDKTYLDSAHWHPISSASAAAVKSYLDYILSRSSASGSMLSTMEDDVRMQFAALINATPLEIGYVQSTMMGENLVFQSISASRPGGNIVTDELHYQGSIYLYRSLQRKGHDVRIVKERNGRIEMKDLQRAVDSNTRLVALSLVSFANGFMHDLERVCALAHAHGAYVYADIVQAVGAIPLDVRASGVDFCACSSYKWLMGDKGIGFLYVRQDLLESVVQRTVYGKMQMTGFENHIFPYDLPLGAPATWKEVPGAPGFFEVGSYSLSGIACLTQSLPYIRQLGVDRIQAHARSLTARLQTELPHMGFTSLTPPEAGGNIVAFGVPDPDALQKVLRQHSIQVTFDQHRMRISASVFNDQSDIDRLLAVLETAISRKGN
jgi:selenocysteine lyase/cysteine desulfurase